MSRANDTADNDIPYNQVLGTWTLFRKEVRRFSKVKLQTILTPMITALLYLVVFAQVLEERMETFPGVSFIAFLVPGLAMMSILQNSFANSSSSMAQSKMNGSIVFILVSPLSPFSIWLAYTAAAMVRGVLVGAAVLLVAAVLYPLSVHNVAVILAFAVLGSALLGVLGILAGIMADKFEHLSAFQNFIIMPLSFLSGVFYSVDNLPGAWGEVSRLNPFFYMIDGFRYGFIGASDANPWLSFGICLAAVLLVSALSIKLLSAGYRLRR